MEGGVMARIRTIKPEFWVSEQVVECSTSARLLFIGMWNFCDDYGVHPASLKQAKMEVFPGDDLTTKDISKLVDELLGSGLIGKFRVPDDSTGELQVLAGKEFWFVTGWHHQRIDRPTFKYPDPRQFDEYSTSARRPLALESTVPESTGVDSTGKDTPPKSPKGDSELFEKIVKAWNGIDGVVHCSELTTKRRKVLKTRLAEPGWLEKARKAFVEITKSNFCKGGGDTGWRADFDWFLQPDSVTKIIEGKYQRNGKATELPLLDKRDTNPTMDSIHPKFLAEAAAAKDESK
jgi:hypothetical protein